MYEYCTKNSETVCKPADDVVVVGRVRQSGLSKQQVGDLFRMKRLGNIRYKVMALVESGSI